MQHRKPPKYALAAALLAAVLFFASCGQNAASSSSPEEEMHAVGGSTRRDPVQSEELQFTQPQTGDLVAIMETSRGQVCFILYPKLAPLAVENFTTLAQLGYYNGTEFHRVIKDFIVQGGDSTGTGTGGESIWGHPFTVERSSSLHHYSGALGMATSKDGNQSQFFVVCTPQNYLTEEALETMRAAGISEEVVDAYRQAGGAPFLDNTSTVFGQVYSGMDVIDKIAATSTDEDARPKTAITVDSVSIEYYGGGAPPSP